MLAGQSGSFRRCRKGLKAEGRQNWGDTGGVEENWGGGLGRNKCLAEKFQ